MRAHINASPSQLRNIKKKKQFFSSG